MVNAKKNQFIYVRIKIYRKLAMYLIESSFLYIINSGGTF